MEILMINTRSKTAIYLAVTSALSIGSAQLQAQIGNTKFGVGALPAPTGSFNSAFGEYALFFNTTGSLNTASGYGSLYANTIGLNNTASGYGSLSFNTTGNNNTAMGLTVLYLNTTGDDNTGSGAGALFNNTIGYQNTASGAYTLFSNTTGAFNTGSGSYSLSSNTTGTANTGSGSFSLYSNSTGINNTAIGYASLFSNTVGSGNTAFGTLSLNANTTGYENTACGNQSLFSNTTGYENTANGYQALFSNTTGIRNTVLGTLAGRNNVNGGDNVFIGYQAGYSETGSNKLYISNNNTTPLLYGEMSATASANKLGIGTNTVAAGDVVNVWNGAHLTTGGVWTNASSRELKDEIEMLSSEDANAALEALSPVRYVYKNSRDEEYVGFIAEDVPDLVATNDHKSLSPMDIVAVLTTVTKEQKAKMTEKDAEIAEQKAVNTDQKLEIDVLRDALVKLESVNREQEDRILQMEMALAEVLRNQSSEAQVSSTH
jgi:Chaperone of endosialidase